MKGLISNYGDFRGLGGPKTASEVQFDLRFETSNLDLPGIHVHITSNNHFVCHSGHGGLQSASGIRSDLIIELSDLDKICSHVSLASNCHYSQNIVGRRRPNIIH